jgi:hypothetical protein
MERGSVHRCTRSRKTGNKWRGPAAAAAGDRLHRERDARLAAGVPIRRGIQSLAAAVGGQHTRGGEHCVAAQLEMESKLEYQMTMWFHF